jgi:hypothetical protein
MCHSFRRFCNARRARWDALEPRPYHISTWHADCVISGIHAALHSSPDTSNDGAYATAYVLPAVERFDIAQRIAIILRNTLIQDIRRSGYAFGKLEERVDLLES